MNIEVNEYTICHKCGTTFMVVGDKMEKLVRCPNGHMTSSKSGDYSKREWEMLDTIATLQRRLECAPDPMAMSRRDWFAGMAMQGLVTSSSALGDIQLTPGIAARIADDLIKELDARKECKDAPIVR